MRDFNETTILIIPFILVAVLVLWSLWKKEKWLMPALLGLIFSSGALIFFLVKQMSPRYGHFDVGYSIGMYASLVATLPLAALGWFLGKKMSVRVSVILAVIALSVNFFIAYTYQYMIKLSADTLNKEVPFDCTKVPYHCAIRDHRLNDIPALKKSGKDIEAPDSLSRSPLWYAINDEAAVKVLLENGANPDSLNIRNETPLSYVLVVSLKTNMSIAKMLVAHGAKVNRTIGFRKPIFLLNFAIVNKNPEVINFLLEHGADPSFVDGYNKSGCDRLKKFPKDQILNLHKYCPEL